MSHHFRYARVLSYRPAAMGVYRIRNVKINSTAQNSLPYWISFFLYTIPRCIAPLHENFHLLLDAEEAARPPVDRACFCTLRSNGERHLDLQDELDEQTPISVCPGGAGDVDRVPVVGRDDEGGRA